MPSKVNRGLDGDAEATPKDGGISVVCGCTFYFIHILAVGVTFYVYTYVDYA